MQDDHHHQPSDMALRVKALETLPVDRGIVVPEAVDAILDFYEHWDSTAEIRYLVLLRRPAGTEGLDEAALAALVTRDSMVGTAVLADMAPDGRPA